MHEQSETVQKKNGKWVNVYGRNTTAAGRQLPGTAEYNTVEEAVAAAEARSRSMGAEAEDPLKVQRQYERSSMEPPVEEITREEYDALLRRASGGSRTFSRKEIARGYRVL